MYNKDADGHAEYEGELPEKLTLADDPATVERKLGKPDTRDEFEGVRKVNGKPQVELWHTYEAGAYRLIFRRLPGEPDPIHPISIGEAEKKCCPGPPGHRRSCGVTTSPAPGRGGWCSSPA